MMTRSRFDAQLARLSSLLSQLGQACEEAIAAASQALNQGDRTQAARVRPLEEEIDRLEREVEQLCLQLLLQQQPVARDLRQISAALKMITDMERIGDQAADIAEITGFLQGRPPLEGIPMAEMATEAGAMVNASVEAFVQRDLELAAQVIQQDDVVDDLFLQIRTALIAFIAASPEEGEFALDLLMIAKYFERIADHAVNIAEWVQFSVTGVHKGADEL